MQEDMLSPAFFFIRSTGIGIYVNCQLRVVSVTQFAVYTVQQLNWESHCQVLLVFEKREVNDILLNRVYNKILDRDWFPRRLFIT